MSGVDTPCAPSELRFDGLKQAFVSGGSRGIGAEVVLGLARSGIDVSFSYNSRVEDASRVEKLGRLYGVHVEGTRADFTRRNELQQLAKYLKNEVGPIDILVNNAGVRIDRAVPFMSEQTWTQVLDVNLTSAFVLSKAFFPTMCRRKKGVITNIGSICGFRGIQGQANYAASKAGLVGLTKVLAREGASHGVRVNIVEPGLIETEMTSEIAAMGGPAVPMNRAGCPSEVAEVVVFLSSNSASYVTGAEFVVDGGLSL